MNWIRLQSEYFRHRKTLRLVRRLGEVAALYPIRLWTWAVEQSIDGSLRDIDPEELAMICGFAGDAGTLWAAMVDCGFIELEDGRAAIRSWDEHQGKLIDRAERNRMRTRAARTRHEARTCSATDVTNERNETNGTDERKPEPASPVLLTFPTEGKAKTWDLTEAHVAEWSPLYPKLDILAECKQALAWVLADASRKKTARGMKSFLVGWFGRSVNRPAAARPAFADRQAALVASLKDGSKAERVDGPSTQARLAALAASLPEDLPYVSRWRREITAVTGEPERVEAILAGMDAMMIVDLREELSAETLADMDAKVRAAQEKASKRSAEPTADLARRFWAQLIRAHYGVPVLSLFSEEAKAA